MYECVRFYLKLQRTGLIQVRYSFFWPFLGSYFTISSNVMKDFFLKVCFYRFRLMCIL